MTPKGSGTRQSRTRGRHQTPAEVVLRMLILKHVRNWSYETLEREVRANVVYRSFCRIGMEKVPDAKTLVRLGQADWSGNDCAICMIGWWRWRRNEGDPGTEDARGHDGGGNQHSLSDRQRLVE